MSSVPVRLGLRDAERDDERQHRRLRGQVELALGERGQDRPLDADQRPDERVDDDE